MPVCHTSLLDVDESLLVIVEAIATIVADQRRA